MESNNIIIYILILLNFISFLIGYIIAKLHHNTGGVYSVSSNKQFSPETISKLQAIQIDNKKFVVDIKTDGLEKKYDTLGETTVSNDVIESSVNKLKNLKG